MQHKNVEIFGMIEKYINDYYKLNGFIPAYKKIANDLCLSTATISRYMKQMKEDGRIISEGNKTLKIQKMVNVNIEVPIVGAISCGTPILAEENIESYIILSKDVIGDRECFILRANGKSMINAGIDDGDLVLINKQEYASNGDVAVILLENDATLKRIFFERDGKVRLHPENDNMEDFYVDNCRIQGIATKVIKNVI